MLRLTMKGRMPKTVLSDMNEESDSIDTMPLVPLPTTPISFGADFNLIRMVEEYGPQRLAEIDKERNSLESRLLVLHGEAQKITKLVEALKS